MKTLRDVLHMAEERAAVLRALDMDRDRDDAEYQDLQSEADDLCDKMSEAIGSLPVAQREQLLALLDPLDAVTYGDVNYGDDT